MPLQRSPCPSNLKGSGVPDAENWNRRPLPTRSKVRPSVASQTGLSRMDLLRSGTQDGSPSIGRECVRLLRPAKYSGSRDLQHSSTLVNQFLDTSLASFE